MLRKKMTKISVIALLLSILSLNQGVASVPLKWNGLGSNNDLNDPSNWIPTSTPTSTDVTEFDNTIPNINTTPNATTDFSVDSIYFDNSASPFTFTFDNSMLLLSSSGITGANTNTTILLNNIDNATSMSAQIDFSGANSTMGNAIIRMTNSGTVSGSTTGADISDISEQITVNGSFSILHGQLIGVNECTEQSSGGNNYVGYMSNQAVFNDTVTSGSNVVFSFSNNGNSESSAGSNHVGYISSNQASFGETLILGNNTIFSLSNSGNNESSAGGDNSIGYISNDQCTFSGSVTLYDHVIFSISNSGNDQSSNGGNNYVGSVGYAQAEFDDAVTLSDNVTFSFSNSGTNTSTGNTDSSYVGYLQEGATSIGGAFTAGNNLTLSTTNVGVDGSNGVGGNQTGYIASGVADAQLEFDDNFTVANNATITLTNSGMYTGTNTSSRNQTGYISGEQFYVNGIFNAGNSLNIHVTNTGEDSGLGVGDNHTGYIDSYQLVVNGPVNLADKDYATFIVENSGIYTGSSTPSSNTVGYTNNDQIHFRDTFEAGNFLSITITNYGEDNATPVDSNIAGYINGHQLNFGGTCSIGDHATITISNAGISTTSTLNQVGVVAVEQLTASQEFTAGKNLIINVTNQATISGSAPTVGAIQSNQIHFVQNLTADDGCFISASNLGDGTVDGSQILFEQGFNILNGGDATFQAINEGTVSSHGIEVQQGSGGNVNIVLGNSSLYVSSPNSDFTIGALNGDITSFVQSLPTLIINTDASVSADFAGDIKDYSAPSTLVKTGLGTQKLSGVNSLTGLTTVQEGTLILTGSLGGAVNVDVNGILKGNGYVAGNVLNTGTIAPGESIGTIHFLSGFTNNNGNYEVEVSGTGLSDLIQVTGDANINGGLVIVSSVDGTYKFQDRYTIVETSGQRIGEYSGVIAVSSLVQPVITDDTQHVYLTLFTNIARAAQTRNQLAIATLLDDILDPNQQQNILLSELVGLSMAEAREGLDSLSGYQHAADLITTTIINRQFIRRLYDPIRSIVTTEPNCCCDNDNNDWSNDCDQDFTAWMDVGGTFMNIRGHNQDPGLTAQGYNITAGIQKTLCQEWTFGVAGAYEQDHLNFKESGGSERCNTWLFGLYGLYRPSCFYGLVDFAYGNSCNHMNRSINVGSLHYKAKSNPDTQQYTFYGELGTDFNFFNTLVQPFIGIETGTLYRKHVNESFANGWGLDVNKRHRSITTTRLGVHLTSNDLMDCGSSLSLDLAWNCMVSNVKNQIHEQFIEFGDPFAINWTEFNRNSINYGITFSMPFGCNWRGYIEGTGESWSHANVFDVVGGLEYCW